MWLSDAVLPVQPRCQRPPVPFRNHQGRRSARQLCALEYNLHFRDLLHFSYIEVGLLVPEKTQDHREQSSPSTSKRPREICALPSHCIASGTAEDCFSVACVGGACASVALISPLVLLLDNTKRSCAPNAALHASSTGPERALRLAQSLSFPRDRCSGRPVP